MTRKAARLITITGPSCSGKTTLAAALARRLGPGQALVVSTDWYYRDLGHLPEGARAAHNFDHPDALDAELLLHHLDRLLTGSPIEAPEYDFVRHIRTAAVRVVSPAPWLILEGLHALHSAEVRRRADLRTFINLSAERCLARRLDRDVRERGRSPESVHAQFFQHVLPMYEQHVAPIQAHADVVLSGEESTAAAVRIILAHLPRTRASDTTAPGPRR